MHPLHLYEGAFSTRRLWARTVTGHRFALPISDWLARRIPGDETLLARCGSSTLDIGCGPGRLSAALTRQGVPALGVDVSPKAVARARARGATAFCGSIFAPIPLAGQWQCALLADGNIGIGGDPAALLTRTGSLIASDGWVYAEVGGPGAPTATMRLQLQNGSGESSYWFPWTEVGVDGLPSFAAAAGLRVEDCWQASGRWFAGLRKG